MTWWRAQTKKNRGWLYFAIPEGETPHAAVDTCLGPPKALEAVDAPPPLLRLGFVVNGPYKLDVFVEAAR